MAQATKIRALGTCNYCLMQEVLRSKQPGYRIVKTGRFDFGMGGITVLALPDGAILGEIKPDEYGDIPHFVAWFMELPDKCCCGLKRR